MANIRASAAATTILVATASAVSIGIATAGGVTATAQPTPVIRASAFAVRMSVLENQTVLMSDFRSFDIGQVTIDVATVTDDVAISFNTSFSDTVTAADAVNTINTAKVVADSVTPAEALTKELTRPDVADSVPTADTSFRSPGLDKTDSVTSADTLNSFDIGTNHNDAVTGADAKVFTISKVLTDSATMSDDSGEGARKFYYAPVGGMVNEHRIHQPLVNGEFVLTTDPNAGIVYTIRTESYSYMFAGYGLNENQLN